jgi:hypothetical protein
MHRKLLYQPKSCGWKGKKSKGKSKQAKKAISQWPNHTSL